MTLYRTKSGSLYEIDGKRVRQVERSSACNSGRVSDEWREAQDVVVEGIGRPIWITWGLGKDEHSDKALQVGEGEIRVRTTFTSPVVEIIEAS